MSNESGAERLSAEERELEAFAIQERFASEYRSGLNPRLSDYLATYPEHTAALTDFVARLLTEGQDDASESQRLPLTEGSRRALSALFGEERSGASGRVVAERRGDYQAGDDAAKEPGAEREPGPNPPART